MGDQDVHDCLLEGGRHIGDVYSDPLHAAGVEIVEDRGFHAAEAEVVAGPADLAPREGDRVGVSLPGCLVDLGAAGIAQADLAGHLVEGLSCRVILGPAQDLILPVIPDQDQMGVAAGDNQAGKGRLESRLRNVIGTDMALDMVDPDQGDPGREAQALGR